MSSYPRTWTAKAAAVAGGYTVYGGGGVAAAGPCRAGITDNGIEFPAALMGPKYNMPNHFKI